MLSWCTSKAEVQNTLEYHAQIKFPSVTNIVFGGIPRNQANNFICSWYLKALFTVNFSHLHYNISERGCEAILARNCLNLDVRQFSGSNCKIAWNCLTSTFKCIVMQMAKVNSEKRYCFRFTSQKRLCKEKKMLTTVKKDIESMSSYCTFRKVMTVTKHLKGIEHTDLHRK